VRQKLAAARPVTLGQAARLDGMTPAALTLLLHHARKAEQPKNPTNPTNQAAPRGPSEPGGQAAE
jgi:tRNA uridine 5-carboxymethylaminomethyl modification enzyme